MRQARRAFHLDRLVSFLARAVFLWTLLREARTLGVLLELGGVAWATFPFWSSIFNQKSLVDCRNSSAFDIDMVLSLTTPGSMRGVLTLTYPGCLSSLPLRLNEIVLWPAEAVDHPRIGRASARRAAEHRDELAASDVSCHPTLPAGGVNRTTSTVTQLKGCSPRQEGRLHRLLRPLDPDAQAGCGRYADSY